MAAEAMTADRLAAFQLRRLRRRWFAFIALLCLLVVGVALAGLALTHPRPGRHYNLAVLVPLLVVLPMLGSAAIGVLLWRFVLTTDINRRLQLIDRQTRRRVGVSLRKGRPIAAQDAETARLSLDSFRRPWTVWLIAPAIPIQLFNGTQAHGVFRWIAFLSAAITAVASMLAVRQRNRTLARGLQVTPASRHPGRRGRKS